jgi:hypothetical protein
LVFKNNLHLREETGPIAVNLPITPTHESAIPAVPENRTDYILAFTEEILNVVALVLETTAVVRPTGRKNLVSHPVTVDFAFV